MRLAAIFLLLFTINLAGCSESSPPANAAEATDTMSEQGVEAEAKPPGQVPPAVEDSKSPPTPESGANFMKPWTGDLDGMEERRVVRVLTVYGPGRYYLEDATEKGLVAESMRLFEDFLNKHLDRGHMRVYVAVIPLARDKLLPALQAGRGDLVVAGLTVTPEREEQVDFSIPASKPIKEILITGPKAPPIDSLEDLSGHTLHLRVSSSYRESLEALNTRLTEQGKAPVTIEPISEMLEDDDLIEMVNGGLLPWAVVDNYKTQLWDDVFENIVIREDIVLREGGRLGWAMRKQSPLLKKAVNDFLKTHREGTLLGNVLRNRYLRDFDWAAHALDEADYQRFEELAHYFQTYGDKYDIEYLLAAAQGYQESRLDQSKRSHTGAVGVMQLLPSTAADPNVGIADIATAENNIHAGIKYLSFLRERYFADLEDDRLNQTLLALAAYNAGPARMRSLRATAEAEGYDPDVWFDNVEIIASRKIGRETVQYVANIYKYYLSYRLTAQYEARHAQARKRAGME